MLKIKRRPLCDRRLWLAPFPHVHHSVCQASKVSPGSISFDDKRKVNDLIRNYARPPSWSTPLLPVRVGPSKQGARDKRTPPSTPAGPLASGYFSSWYIDFFMHSFAHCGWHTVFCSRASGPKDCSVRKLRPSFVRNAFCSLHKLTLLASDCSGMSFGMMLVAQFRTRLLAYLQYEGFKIYLQQRLLRLKIPLVQHLCDLLLLCDLILYQFPLIKLDSSNVIQNVCFSNLGRQIQGN